jgi:hypothetical protein
VIVGRRATGTWALASAHAGYRLDGAFFISRSTPFSRGVRDIVADIVRRFAGIRQGISSDINGMK